MSEIPNPPLQMESWASCLEGFIFFCSRRNFIFFFQFPFDIFWNSINLAYVSQLREEDLISNYLFNFQRESHSVSDMYFFATLSIILSRLELSREYLTMLTSSNLMEIVTFPVVLVDQFCFYMHQSTKAWLFEKIIFVG